LTLWGFDAGDASADISGTSATLPEPAAQIPAHPTPADPLAAFVASLSGEQRAALVGLLSLPRNTE